MNTSQSSIVKAFAVTGVAAAQNAGDGLDPIGPLGPSKGMNRPDDRQATFV